MATIATNITVTDSITHAPIVGANVFADGIGQGATNSSGQITLQLLAGTFTLSVTQSGYLTQTLSNNVAGTAYSVLLVSASSILTVSCILNVYPEEPAVGQSFTFDNNGSPISVTYQTGGVTVDDLTFGGQTVTATISGYQPISQGANLGLSTVITIELTASTDLGVAQGASPTSPTTTNITVNTLPAITSATNYEFVPPNTSQGTYFTITQARLYIGRVFIDELNGIQFALQNNKIPIYGYASRDFDAIAQGKALVQGQFTINFISEGYLSVVLKDYAKNISSDSTPQTPTQTNQAMLNSLVTKLQNPDPAWTPEILANSIADVKLAASSLGPRGLASAQAAMKTARNNSNNSILGLAGGDYPNAVYDDTEFDIVIQYEGAGRTVIRKLESCRLISNESIMDHSGTPILDSYGFIARRLR